MALSPLDFPASPTIGQTYPSPVVAGQPTYIWDGADWLSYFALGKAYVPLDGSTAMTGLLTLSGDPTAALGAVTKQYADAVLAAMQAINANAGYFVYVSATQVAFAPWQGSQVKINGVNYTIPAAGVTSAPTGTFVNGVGAQNLLASTLYYVYVFNNAGAPTLDFSTTAPAVSATAGNVGTLIKTGDDTRTLVGMVYTSATSQFTVSNVISWFNKKARQAFTTDAGSGTVAVVDFVTWGDEAISFHLSSQANNSAGSFVGLQSSIDGVNGTQVIYTYAPTAGAFCCSSLSGATLLGAGHHAVGQFISANGAPSGARQETYVTFRG